MEPRDYFLKNWHPLRTEWTVFTTLPNTFGNPTNNRCESINEKLKKSIGEMRNFCDAVNNLLKWKCFNELQIKIKIMKNFGSAMPVHCEVQHLYLDVLMENPFKLVKKELELSSFVSFDNNTNDIERYEIHKCQVQTSDVSCNCKIFNGYGLPCKHIFAVRAIKELDWFDNSLYLKRWAKEYCNSRHKVFKNFSHPMTEPTIRQKNHPPC